MDLLMRKGLADSLKFYRRFPVEFEALSWDAWMTTHSPLPPKKLHALGYVQFAWNACEHHLFSLLAEVIGLPERDVWTLAHDLGDIAVVTRIKILAKRRYKDDPVTVRVIENALEVYDICRQNRNQLTHFDIAAGLGSDVLTLFRRSKNPETRDSPPFPDSLNDIRRVGRDIRRLSGHLQHIWMVLLVNRVQGRREPLPNILRVPEPLWKPLPHVPTKRKRRPPSSRT
jgi:hypothetical protein